MQLDNVRFLHKNAAALDATLAACPDILELRVRLSTTCLDAGHDGTYMAVALKGLPHLQALRLQTFVCYTSPFNACMRELHTLRHLRKLTLLTDLTAAGRAHLAAYLTDATASHALEKLKSCTWNVAVEVHHDAVVLEAVRVHGGLRKLTIVRPDGRGTPLERAECRALARAVASNCRLTALHLRVCGVKSESLRGLLEPVEGGGDIGHITHLRLDGNYLGCGDTCAATLDALLARCPRLTHVNLSHNFFETCHAVALAASLARHKLPHLQCLSLGSNKLGDDGLVALLGALPRATLQELYLHGIECTDMGATTLRAWLPQATALWGLGACVCMRVRAVLHVRARARARS